MSVPSPRLWCVAVAERPNLRGGSELLVQLLETGQKEQ
jgi:hypothetical protein